jgi:hypothetical protein
VRARANELADLSDEVADRLDSGDSCGAAESVALLRERLTAAINDGKVPEAYLEELSGATNELALGVPNCKAPPPPPDTGEDNEGEDDNDDGKKHKRKKEKKKDKQDRDDTTTESLPTDTTTIPEETTTEGTTTEETPTVTTTEDGR